MTKTHFQAKLCKQKLPTPHRALLKHLKENTRWQSASAQRVNSPVKRLFTAVHSLRLEPLDSGYVCFFSPSSFLPKNVFLQGWKNVSRSLGGQIRVELTLQRTTPFVCCSTAPMQDRMRSCHLVAGGRPAEGPVCHFWGCFTLKAKI